LRFISEFGKKYIILFIFPIFLFSCWEDINSEINKDTSSEKIIENSVNFEDISMEEVKEFLKIYKIHEWKNRPELDSEEYYKYYAPNFKIIDKRTLKDWSISLNTMNQHEYKASAIKVIELYWREKLKEDYAVLYNIKYEKNWDLYKISWDRYENFINDTKPFYTVVWKIDWEIKIIEEYSESIQY